MLRGNIAASSLKLVWKNLNSVNCYENKHECNYIKSVGKFPVGLNLF